MKSVDGKLNIKSKIMAKTVDEILEKLSQEHCKNGSWHYKTEDIKKAMIESSQKIVSLAIAEKLNTCQRIKVCDLEQISTLITELDPDDIQLRDYASKGIEIL